MNDNFFAQKLIERTRSWQWSSIAGATAFFVILAENRVVDDLLRHTFAPNTGVGGPIIYNFNVDNTALVFVLLCIVVWSTAEITASWLKLKFVSSALLALGAFYLGNSFAIAGGIRGHYWLQQAADQVSYRVFGSFVFAVIFIWRFRPSKFDLLTAAAIWIIWFFWLGEAATHEGQSLGGMYR